MHADNSTLPIGRTGLAIALFLIWTCTTNSGRAAQVWIGPLFNFAVPAGADWTNPNNQDRITASVRLARNTTRGLFNAAFETSYASFFSPSNTAWAFGALTDYATLSYNNWEAWNGHNPPTMVGEDAVLHLLSDDIYLSINFTSWGGSGGGFAYTRSTQAFLPEPSVTSLVLIGLPVYLRAQRRRRRAES